MSGDATNVQNVQIWGKKIFINSVERLCVSLYARVCVHARNWVLNFCLLSYSLFVKICLHVQCVHNVGMCLCP